MSSDTDHTPQSTGSHCPRSGNSLSRPARGANASADGHPAGDTRPSSVLPVLGAQKVTPARPATSSIAQQSGHGSGNRYSVDVATNVSRVVTDAPQRVRNARHPRQALLRLFVVVPENLTSRPCGNASHTLRSKGVRSGSPSAGLSRDDGDHVNGRRDPPRPASARVSTCCTGAARRFDA